MFYDKKIKYLDYYENGSRVRGAGYVRLEARDQSLRMELAVTNLHPTDSFEREVFLCAGTEEKSLDVIRLSGGRGQYRGQWSDSTDIGGTGIDYARLTGIHIPLGSGRELSCSWKGQPIPSSRSTPIKQEETMPSKNSPKEGERTIPSNYFPEEAEKNIPSKDFSRDAEKIIPSKISPKEAEGTIPSKISPKEAERTISSKNSPKEAESIIPSKDSPKETEKVISIAGMTNKKKTEAEMPKLLEEKWEQLWSIYPHLRPFQDKREYLSIKPADFVIFSAPSYRMINNSFLLHGYYNYKHLILARIEKRGEIRYYIGVPGNFFEKEKQVAIMFGFESFECAEEPAQAGDFGYYMMRIEI